MKWFLLVGLGGFFGANARFWVSTALARYVEASLPWGTLVANLTGSFIIGFFLAWTSERVFADPSYRLVIAVGFCGAYTTFSSYAFETVAMLEQGNYGAAAGNFLLNNILAVVAVMLGIALARWI